MQPEQERLDAYGTNKANRDDSPAEAARYAIQAKTTHE